HSCDGLDFSLQKQVSIMSLNLNAKIDEIQCHQHADTSAALLAIRSQLQDLTKSVESCQSEVVEVKRDMVAIKHEIDTLQAAKEEIEELRDAVDRLEEQTRRRKIRLLEQDVRAPLRSAGLAIRLSRAGGGEGRSAPPAA
ncbi:putative glucose transporter type 1 isoform X1, partial [Penaeus vannamei]